jgi:endonuclease G
MKHSIKTTLLLLGLSGSAGADILSVHCPLGCPSNPQGNDLVFGHVYALSNNPETKFADWVAYEVDVLNFGNSPGRAWKADPLLEDNETLEPTDYKSVSDIDHDRGHQAPLGSFAGSRYWSELNYLSNITPQHADLNQGAWKRLEDAVRESISYRDTLFVITGPIYNQNSLKLPNADQSDKHEIPSSYFKIIYDDKGNAASFVMEQSTPKNADFCTKQKPITEIASKINSALPGLTNSSVVASRIGC